MIAGEIYIKYPINIFKPKQIEEKPYVILIYYFINRYIGGFLPINL